MTFVVVVVDDVEVDGPVDVVAVVDDDHCPKLGWTGILDSRGDVSVIIPYRIGVDDLFVLIPVLSRERCSG